MMKLALVTGGNRGIGLAVCEDLAKKGIRVLLGSRSQKRGKEAAEALQSEGLDVSSIEIDVSQKESIERAAEEIGTLDILINNAGVLPKATLLGEAYEEMLNGFQVNLMGPINCIRTFAPGMVERGYGRIVNVSSGWGSFDEGLQGPAVYSISKAALNAVTMTTARALTGDVKINSMCPGWVHTGMGGENAPRTPEEGADTIIWLATLPESGPSGRFFRDRVEISW